MDELEFGQLIVVSSYVDGREIYKGRNIEKARQLARASGDKHTFYLLSGGEGSAKLTIRRCYKDGTLDSSEFMDIKPWEIKHFKTLISLLG